LVVVVTVIVVMTLSLTGCCLFNRPPQALIQVSLTEGPPPLTVEFNGSGSVDSDGEIVEYRWDFGDGTSGSGITVTHTYDSKGIFTATLTVRDGCGAQGTAAVTIQVTNAPPVAQFTYSPTGPSAGETISFDAAGSYDAGGEIATYAWDFGDGKDGAGKIVAHVYDSAGSYQVTLTVTDDDGATDQESKQIVVDPKGSLRNLVIYELLPNPSGDEPDDEYIKLHNRSDERVSIAGWLLTDGEGSYRIPRGTEIGPHGFWTVYGSTYNPTGCPVCLYLANEGDCVQLLEAGANLTDECCYSTTGMDQVIRCH